MRLNTNTYETEMQVRPDDIDMFQHVHSSRYTDYVLAARYDQMGRCYGMSMGEFLENGLGWVIRKSTVEFKRPLLLGDSFIVKTRLTALERNIAAVEFEIVKKETNKISCKGTFDYVMTDLKTGKAAIIPDWILERYSLPE